MENEKLKYKLDEAHEEISKLRKKLLSIGGRYPDHPGSDFKEELKADSRKTLTPKNKPLKIEEAENEEDEEGEEEEGEEETSEESPTKKNFMSTAPI
jgi:hypothetical protein